MIAGMNLSALVRGCAILIGLLAGVAYDTLASDHSAKIAPDARRAIQSGELTELLVEYDDTAINAEVRNTLLKRRLKREDPTALALRKQRYRELKQRNLTALRANDAEIQRDFSHLPMAYLRIRDSAALDRLLASNEVIRVYSSRNLELLATNLDMIGQPQATQLLGQTGAGSTIAVLDTGVNHTSLVFGSCTAPGIPSPGCRVLASVDVAPNDGALDNVGHGTTVAATALAAAPSASIASVDVYDHTISGASDVTIIAGIDWAIANQSAYNIVAINISLGGGPGYADPCAGDNPLVTPVQHALSAGMLTVVASGNNGYANGINWPACTPAVVSVGAVYENNTGSCSPGLKDSITCFSNISDYLSLLAPATATSYAAPLAAGAAAVLASAYPLETPTDWSSRMITSGKPIQDNRIGSVTGLGYTIPRLDMAAALLYPDTSAPDNDAIANAGILTGASGATPGWNYFASLENGEPAHGQGGAHSVWWRWTASTSGTLTLDTHRSNFDTLLAVYASEASGVLLPVASNDDEGSNSAVSGLNFHADAGATYYFVVDGKDGATGTVFLNHAFVADPATAANLSVRLEDSPDPVSSSAPLTYAITVKNSGPGQANNVLVTFTPPTLANVIATPPGCTLAAGKMSCSVGNLQSGGQVILNMQFGGLIEGLANATVIVTSDSPEAYTGNDSTEAVTTITAPLDGDVPLPAWAFWLLGGGLYAAMLGRRSKRSE